MKLEIINQKTHSNKATGKCAVTVNAKNGMVTLNRQLMEDLPFNEDEGIYLLYDRSSNRYYLMKTNRDMAFKPRKTKSGGGTFTCKKLAQEIVGNVGSKSDEKLKLEVLDGKPHEGEMIYPLKLL